jgi:hypothetical protein
VLASGRVKVESCRIRHIAPSIVRDEGDVIAYFVLLRPAFQRSKGIAHLYVRRPGNSAVRAVRVEQLRIGVVCGIPCIEPHRVDASIGRHSDCAEVVIFAVINRVVIDPVRRAKACSTVCAAREHYIRSRAEATRQDSRHHVNVIVRGTAGAVHGQKNLSG